MTGDQLKLVRIARFPVGERAMSVGELITLSPSRQEDRVLDDVEKLIQNGCFEEVLLEDGSRAVSPTDFVVKRMGLLPLPEILLVRLPAEEMVMRLDQLARLTGRLETGLIRNVESLISRGFLEWRPILHGERPAIWPTRQGLQETGFSRALYSPLPALQRWPHTFTVINVRELLLKEFGGLKRGSAYEWESERVRSRIHSRTEMHLPDGILRRRKEIIVAAEIQMTRQHAHLRRDRIRELSSTYPSTRIYCIKETWQETVGTIEELGVENVDVLKVPGELIYPAARTRGQ